MINNSIKNVFICTLVLCVMSYTTAPAFAFEVDVVEGRADITTEGGRTTITADTKSVFEGNTDIPQGHVVEIMQGGHDILLRDITGTQTDWLGSLLSNGNVLLINPHGVFIAQSASIEVASLLASTLDVSNEAFMAGGSLGFQKVAGMDPARILNEADITLQEGGYLVLLADDIENTGTITAYQGTVAMGVGKKATISFEQDGLVNFVVDEGIDNAIADKGINNQGIIQAEGGRIELTARTMNDTFDQLINNDGEVRASGAVVRDGVVELVSNGGIKSHGSLKTDTLHEEGSSFSIGGDFHVGESYHDNLDGAITYAADTNVSGTINDTDNIVVNAGVTLTETADTTFNADSDADGTGAFTMDATADIDGGGFNLTINMSDDSTIGIVSNVETFTIARNATDEDITLTSATTTDDLDVTTFYNTTTTSSGLTFVKSVGDGTTTDRLIYDVTQLQTMEDNLGWDYQLANNIDASATTTWNAGAGFDPIGNFGSKFTGALDGGSYTVSGLFINLPSVNDIGLIGVTDGAVIENINVSGADIAGDDEVGIVVGQSDNSTIIRNVSTSGSISADNIGGGLAGFMEDSSTIENSSSSATVTAVNYAGGLVGWMSTNSSIDNSYATGDVTGTNDYIGGLVGAARYSVTIDNSYATGTVSGVDFVGGLTGDIYYGDIDNSYATGDVNGTNQAGGLVGLSNYQNTLTNVYATGDVSGTTRIGGLIGYADGSSANTVVNNSYATGDVSGTSEVGGFLGANAGGGADTDIANSFSTGAVTGNTAVDNSVGAFLGSETSINVTNTHYSGTATNSGGGALTVVGTSEDDVTDFYDIEHAVYALGAAGGWDAATVWDIYTDAAPTLLFQDAGAGTDHFVFRGTTDTDWATGSNWQTETVPGAGDDVYIVDVTNDSVIGASVSVNDFNVYSGSVTQSADLTVAGDFLQTGGTFSAADPANDTLDVAGDFQITSTDDSFMRYTGDGLSSGTAYVIYDVYGLQAMKQDLDAFYELNGNIDAAVTSGWNAGDGWEPVGTCTGSCTSGSDDDPYVGTFDGGSYTISDLVINRPTEDNVGLFGNTYDQATPANSGVIQNVGLTGASMSISGDDTVGALIGHARSSTVTNAYATGPVTATTNNVGGLIGSGTSVNISNSYATGDVTGNTNTGGFIGQASSATISNSYASGDVTGGVNTGGLIGDDTGDLSLVTNNYATGDVSGTSNVGGFLGRGATGTLSDNYATGDVSGTSSVGGLVGEFQMINFGSSGIQNSYASGDVTATDSVGGLIGNAEGFASDVSITNSYATGDVIGNTASDDEVGGIYGGAGFGTDYDVTNTFYAGDVTNNGGGALTVDGTFEDDVTDFYDIEHPVYDLGQAGGWDVGTDWDIYSDAAPTLVFQEAQAGSEYFVFRGTTDTDWATDSNWQTEVAPGMSDDVYIVDVTNDPVIGASASVNDFNMYSGSVTQSADFIVAGDYTQTGGTLSAGGNAINVGGSWTVSGGTFTNGNNTVTFNASGSSETITSGGEAFYDVVFDDAGTGSTWTLQDAFDADNDVTITGGELAAGANTLAVGGSWVNADTFTSGTSTITFDGTGSETITAGGSSFYNLVFNGVGSTYTQLDDLTITNDFTITQGSFVSDPDYDYSVGNDFTIGGFAAFNQYVQTIAIDGDGNIYAGGSFTNAGGVSGADYIAYWDGASWNALGSGLNSTVYVVEISGSDVYAGGNFTDAGGVGDADRIAYWDGVNWNALGSGLNSSVQDIEINGSDVYAGGSFTDAGGVSAADRIAYWDGGSWNALGSGLNSSVYAVEISGTDVYAGGFFTDAGGVGAADRIARWDGASWNALGSGLNLVVYDIEISGTDVYAGGLFTDAGGVGAADRIARWDGASWNALGSGLNNQVQDIEISGTDVYAGGLFTDAGGVDAADYIAYWDGGSWNALGSGLTEVVADIEINGSDVYAVGDEFLKKFTNSQWASVSPEISDVSFKRATGSGTVLDPYIIRDVYGLQGMGTSGFLDETYELANSIDAAATTNWNDGFGFIPIGSESAPFTGDFDGKNETIDDLFINGESLAYTGLFGYVDGSTIQNSGTVGGSVSGNIVGGLIGYAGNAVIRNVYNTGDVSGDLGVGGLIGFANLSTISEVYMSGDIAGSRNIVGGLIGIATQIMTSNAYVTGSVSGDLGVGGLIGYASQVTISDTYATGNVTGSDYIGGLVGYNLSSATIGDSYATGDVTGRDWVGGLVGRNYNSSSILNSYATGNVIGEDKIGGLVGWNDLNSTIDNSYATGAVTGDTFVGGLAGSNDYEITNSFATGIATSSGDMPGGLIGEDGGGTYTNNWWYNETNTVDIGDEGNVDDAQIAKASAVSDFYNPQHAVYDIGGANEWDFFTPVWDTFEGALPRLSWEEVAGARIFWSGLTDTSWNDAGNWSSAAIPTSGDDVYILDRANDPVISSSNSVNDFNMYSGSVTQSADFIVAGDFLQTGGTFTAADPANDTLDVAGDFQITSTDDSFMRYTGDGLSSGTAYVIYDVYGLQAMKQDLDAFYELNGNIDAAVTSGWNSGEGWDPVGDSTTKFTGNFDGDDNTISGLTILRTNDSDDNQGLFGYVDGSGGVTIENVGLVGGSISVGDGDYAGMLIGRADNMSQANGSAVSNNYATGDVSGDFGVGGLIGDASQGYIVGNYTTGSISGGSRVGGLIGGAKLANVSNNFSTGDVSGSGNVGGLVGYGTFAASIDNNYATGNVVLTGSRGGGLVGDGSFSIFSRNYATGDVTGFDTVGGLVGNGSGSTIQNSYATGNVTATGTGIFTQGVGGLVAASGTIANSYATGDVSGIDRVGGLVSYAFSSNIDNSYATGSVNGDDRVGGLIAHAKSGTLDNSYATGNVTGDSVDDYIGALVGFDEGVTITNSYYSGSAINEGSGSLTVVGASESDAMNFYTPDHAVYDIGDTASGGDGNVQWDVFTPEWDTFSDTSPHLTWENYSGDLNYVWSGNADSTWSDASNWVSVAVPTNSNDVFIFDRTNDPVVSLVSSARDVNIDSGGILTLNNTLYVAGDWNNAGTFTHGNNTVNFNGGNQTITGDNTFYNLTKIASGSETLTFDSASTQTVEGLLKLKGQNRASPMTLQSNSSGDQWSFSAARKSLSFLRVKDSFHAGSSLVYCLNGCVDLGNNTNWRFAFFEQNVDEDVFPIEYEQGTVSTEDIVMKAAADDVFLDRLVFYDCSDLFGAGSEGCTPWNDSLLMLPSGVVKRVTIINFLDF